MINRIKKNVYKLKWHFLYYFPVTHPRKILFDHLPKCGGSTLNAYLEKHYPGEKIFSTDGLGPSKSVKFFKSLPEKTRHQYCLIKGHGANELLDYADHSCLKVTVLRDPVERIISHYYYAKRKPNHYLYSKIHESSMSLRDYASSDLSGELRNWYTTHFSGMPVDIAEENPETSVSKAADTLLKCYDVVGLLEDFSAFIKRLRKEANLIYKYDNNRVNVTENRLSIEDIPQSTIRKIEEVNHLDIALYSRIKNTIR